MAINFNNVPDKNPAMARKLVPDGLYLLKITKAEMKAPKDKTKKAYLEITYECFNAEGEKLGLMWDKLFESESPYILWKIKRFLEALEISLSNFELKDLAKIIVGKELLGEVKIREEEGKAPMNEIDIFKGDIYYPKSAMAEKFNLDLADASDEEDIFNTSDDTEY